MYVIVNGKCRVVKQNCEGKFYYVKNGKRVITTKPVVKGKKPKRSCVGKVVSPDRLKKKLRRKPGPKSRKSNCGKVRVKSRSRKSKSGYKYAKKK